MQQQKQVDPAALALRIITGALEKAQANGVFTLGEACQVVTSLEVIEAKLSAPVMTAEPGGKEVSLNQQQP
jgi:hypothetical protein